MDIMRVSNYVQGYSLKLREYRGEEVVMLVSDHVSVLETTALVRRSLNWVKDRSALLISHLPASGLDLVNPDEVILEPAGNLGELAVRAEDLYWYLPTGTRSKERQEFRDHLVNAASAAFTWYWMEERIEYVQGFTQNSVTFDGDVQSVIEDLQQKEQDHRNHAWSEVDMLERLAVQQMVADVNTVELGNYDINVSKTIPSGRC